MSDLRLLPNPGADETPNDDDRLDSWKEIGAFLKKDLRTAQRWELERGLPVHRYPGDKGVFAYRSEIEEWLRSDSGARSGDAAGAPDEAANTPEEPGLAHEGTKTGDARAETSPSLRTLLWRVLVVLAVAAALLMAYRSFVSTRPHKVKVMVRTLQNLSPGTSDAFSQGMTDQIITGLGRANPEQLGVLARTTANLYSKKTIAELRSLGLDYVIEGSVYQDNDRVRINTQLIDTRDGTQVSAKSYEGESKGVLDLQAAAADDIVRSLKLPIKVRLQPRKVNPQAYDAYMRGQYAWGQRGQESVPNSVMYFKQAIAFDPSYAPAYAGLADAYALLASAQYGILPPVEGFGEAKRLAERSVELDPDLAAPHACLGYIALVFDRNPEAARKEFEKAIQLDPNYVTAHQWFGQYYEVIGNIDEAIREIRLAYEREPASIPVNLALAEAYYFKRDYDAAIEQSRSTVQLEPASAIGHYNLGRAYDMKGWHDQALTEFMVARSYAPNIATLVPLSYEYARMGDLASSTQYLNQLLNFSAKDKKYVPALYFTMIYIGRNDKDEALKWLAKADEERCDYIVFLSRDPMVDFLRGDPRFQAFDKLSPIRPGTASSPAADASRH